MIARISIEKLHDLYDYDIRIPDEQRVSIITGPNGYGKTTLLKIISHVLERKFWYFYFLRFNNLAIDFRNGLSIVIKKELDETEENSTSEIVSTKESIRIELHAVGDPNIFDSIVLKSTYLARLARKYDTEYVPYRGALDLEDVLEREYTFYTDTYLMEQGRNILMFLQERSCQFIKEQRLFSISNSVPTRRKYQNGEYEINVISRELKEMFAQKQMEFASNSQEIDATFISRLIKNKDLKYEEREFRIKLDSLKKKINDYRKYGLTPKTDILEEYPSELRNVLSLYIDDMEAKLSIFEDFYTRLSVFDRFVSGKSLSNKRIELNDKKGICIYNDNDEEVPLNKLSSGEQNLIILYYRLAFTTRKNSLLLIDEPENSLHMAWLSLMLEDYQQMADSLKCQIIIATHSPVFINSRWGITFDLYTNSQENKANQ